MNPDSENHFIMSTTAQEFSQDPVEGTTEDKQSAHKRNYQACIPCRRRKVKCDLHDVDHPRRPCKRCEREMKDCVFTETRRKRKSEDVKDELSDDDQNIPSEEPQRGTTSFSEPDNFVIQPKKALSSKTRSKIMGSDSKPLRPLPLPSYISRLTPSENESINTDTAAKLQKSEIYSTKDTLNTLSELEAFAAVKRRQTLTASDRSQLNLFPDRPYPQNASLVDGSSGDWSTPAALPNKNGSPLYTLANASGIHEALSQWQQTRFVRAGWFTASEAIRYIDFFYEHLLPLSPIGLPDFKESSTHGKLLSEEPMLAVTILTVSSRHMVSEYPENFVRNIMVHQRLWDFLESMIKRIAMGDQHIQEDFVPGLKLSNLKTASLRSIGAIESLLILTEWHPCAIHFRSCDYSDSILVEDPHHDNRSDLSDDLGRFTLNINESCAWEAEIRKTESWVYPQERGDRMALYFIGLAVNIASELGIPTGRVSSQLWSPERAKNVRCVLYVISVQTSGRLSLPSMIVQDNWSDIFNEINSSSNIIYNPHSSTDASALGHNSAVNVQDAIHHFWYRIAYLLVDANRKLFPSPEHSKKIITSGRYRSFLIELDEKQKFWRNDFDACGILPESMRHVLDIEYNYMRVYCHNIALQAVVNRCISNEPKTDGKAYSAETVAKWMGSDRQYIDMIIQDSLALLTCIVDKVYPQKLLKHVPNRTLLRLPGVSTILVKAFTFGVDKEILIKSFALLDRTAAMLDATALDDLHNASSFAILIRNLNLRVRSSIVQVNQRSRSTKRRLHSRSASAGAASTSGALTPASCFAPSLAARRLGSTGVFRGGPGPSPLNQVTVPIFSSHGQGSFIPAAHAQNGYAPHDMNANLAYSQPQFQQASQQATQNPGIFGYNFQAPIEISSNAAWGQSNPEYSIMPPPGYMSANNMQSAGSHQTNESIYYRGNASQLAPGSASAAETANFSANIQPDQWFGFDLTPFSQFQGAEVQHSPSGPLINGQCMLEPLLSSRRSPGIPQDWPNFNDQER